MPALLTVTHRRGIYLPEADLWLDPPFGVERAFISHAHSDHVARHQVTYTSPLTHKLLSARYGLKKNGTYHALPLHSPFQEGDWQFLLLPAGHIPGSAMLHLTRVSDGATLLYTGDYKLRHGLSTEPCQLRPAETLIMETTFGRPHYHFPPAQETIARLHHFIHQSLADHHLPVLLGYSLGKAQEILRALHGLPHPIMLHPSVWEMTQTLLPHLGPLPPHRLFDAAEAPGHILLFPPGSRTTATLQGLPPHRTLMLTGWALQPSARYRYRVHEILPLSDHADYPELLETVRLVSPRRTYLVHGYTREFAADLRALGHEAWSLERADQLELPLQFQST